MLFRRSPFSSGTFPTGTGKTLVRRITLAFALIFAGLASVSTGPNVQASSETFEAEDHDQLIAAIVSANQTAEPAEIELTGDDPYTLIAPYLTDPNEAEDQHGLPTIESDITILGNGTTIERAVGEEAPKYRIFAVTSGASLTLNDVTVRGGDVSSFFNDGGAIWNAGTLVLNNAVIEDSQADSRGGAIFNIGALEVVDSEISNNSANQTGGGIEIGDFFSGETGSAEITGSEISHNEAGTGGGIFNEDSDLTIDETTLHNNVANNSPGITNTGVLHLSNSTISDNEAGNNAGGLDNAGIATVINTTISGNTGARIGGGIRNSTALETNHDAELQLIASTVTGNTATSSGGGISSDASLEIISSTIVNNEAEGSSGGGIHQSGTNGEPLTMFNTIVASNESEFSGNDVDGTVENGSSNLVGDGSEMSGLEHGVDGNLVGTAADPIDPMLGDLADNDGPTLTHALLEDSPAIDAGLPSDHEHCENATDQRGVERPQGEACDIGAYEFEVEEVDDPLTPEEQIENLIAEVEAADVHRSDQLTDTLDNVLHHLDHDRVAQACGALDRFISHVERQSWQQDGLSDEQVVSFLEAAEEVREQLECQ